MTAIRSITAREILDSRGKPTLEAEVVLQNGARGIAAVPSGASTGSHEAVELRDGGKRYGGAGVLKAVANVNDKIASLIKGMKAENQQEIDLAMIKLDGTDNKANLGANAILGVSLAVAKAAAADKGWQFFEYLNKNSYSLPIPMLNILNGGKHADNGVDFQEFMIMPVGLPSFSEALAASSEVYMQLKSVLKKKGLDTNVGDEGGFAPSLRSNAEAVELILEAIEHAGYKSGKDFFIALDPASTEFFKDGKYKLAKEGKILSSEQMTEYYAKWCTDYHIISIEDALSEDDWAGWAFLRKTIGEKIQLVGDDLYVTNIKRLEQGIKQNSSNSILIKLNQIGTLSETIAAINMAKKANWTAVTSHRSGETEDTTIADLCVGLATGQIKTGAPARSERTAKYNRLLKIEQLLGKKAKYAGRDAFYNLKRRF